MIKLKGFKEVMPSANEATCRCGTVLKKGRLFDFDIYACPVCFKLKVPTAKTKKIIILDCTDPEAPQQKNNGVTVTAPRFIEDNPDLHLIGY